MSNTDTPYVTITKAKLKEYRKAYYKLQALEAGGVDNWEGYDHSLQNYLKTNPAMKELFNHD